MACNQTLNGLIRDCEHSMGGVTDVLITHKDNIAGVTITDGKISAIDKAEESKFYKYFFARNTASATSTYTIDHTTGVKFVTTDLVMIFNRMETTKRVEVTALAQNELVVIYKDANGKYWYLGYNEPVMMSAGDGMTGTARADRNGYSVTLQDNSHEMPYEVDESIIAGLL